jgi:hypothetical protein
MTDRVSLIIWGDAMRSRAMDLVRGAPKGYRVTVQKDNRSLVQNAKMWAMLTEVAEQVHWDHGEFLSPEDWKLVFLDGLKRETRTVTSLDRTGFVNLNTSSSVLTTSEMADMITLIEMFGANHGVIFKDEEPPPAELPESEGGPTPSVPEASAVSFPGPQPEAADVPSDLSPNWRGCYIAAMTRPGSRKDTLKIRHEQAAQMIGGIPNPRELSLMRKIYRCCLDYKEGRIPPNLFWELMETYKVCDLPPDPISSGKQS